MTVVAYPSNEQVFVITLRMSAGTERVKKKRSDMTCKQLPKSVWSLIRSFSSDTCYNPTATSLIIKNVFRWEGDDHVIWMSVRGYFKKVMNCKISCLICKRLKIQRLYVRRKRAIHGIYSYSSKIHTAH